MMSVPDRYCFVEFDAAPYTAWNTTTQLCNGYDLTTMDAKKISQAS